MLAPQLGRRAMMALEWPDHLPRLAATDIAKGLTGSGRAYSLWDWVHRTFDPEDRECRDQFVHLLYGSILEIVGREGSPTNITQFNDDPRYSRAIVAGAD